MRNKSGYKWIFIVNLCTLFEQIIKVVLAMCDACLLYSQSALQYVILSTRCSICYTMYTVSFTLWSTVSSTDSSILLHSPCLCSLTVWYTVMRLFVVLFVSTCNTVCYTVYSTVCSTVRSTDSSIIFCTLLHSVLSALFNCIQYTVILIYTIAWSILCLICNIVCTLYFILAVLQSF